jgi:predicted lipopolysaccharide heptosyltransferase III
VIAIRTIGDLVLVTPVLRLVKQRVPASYLAVLADGLSAEVLQHNPHVDRMIVIDRSLMRKLRPWQRVREEWKILRNLRDERFDTVVDLFSGPRSALWAWLSGARDRYSEDYRQRLRGFLYNHPVKVTRDGTHLVEQKLQIVGPLVGAVERSAAWLELVVTREEQDRARHILSSRGVTAPKLVGLVPSAGLSFRRWPVDRFARVADRLVDRYGVKIVLFSSRDEEEMAICRSLAQSMTHKTVDLAGLLTLRELMACLRECDLVISNDTGPMHIAVGLNKPGVVALYGAANTIHYAPWGSTAVMITKGTPGQAYWKAVDYERDFHDHLLRISPEDVIACIEDLPLGW